MAERHCFCCNQTYEFCTQGCKGQDPSETWRFLFDNENCLNIYDLWQALRGKQITEEEFRNSIKAMDIKDILEADTLVSKDVKRILDAEKKTPVKKPMMLPKSKATEVKAEGEKTEKTEKTE